MKYCLLIYRERYLSIVKVHRETTYALESRLYLLAFDQDQLECWRRPKAGASTFVWDGVAGLQEISREQFKCLWNLYCDK